MKNHTYLLILLLILLFSGCANKSEPQESHNIETSEPEKPETAELDNRANSDDMNNTDSDSNTINVPNPTTKEIDLSDQFRGINGCAVIYDSDNNEYSIYNASLCEQEVSPYSTFKIVSTLAGLNNGVIENEHSTMSYSEEKYPLAEWNENLSLENAFQTSCIWYFRQIIDEVGQDEIQYELMQLEYGNCDISEWDGGNVNPMPDLNGFWLGSSLKISPLEQVQVLAKIFEGQSLYSAADVALLKEIMLVSEDTKRIYGKTGSGPDGEAWFVGFTEDNGARIYFAVYLNDNTQTDKVSGSVAKEIANEILEPDYL